MPTKRGQSNEPRGERRKKKMRVLSEDQISKKSLREVLKVRLLNVLDSFGRATEDVEEDGEALSLIAASISQMERALKKSPQIPDVLYTKNEKGHLQCQFRSCSSQQPFARPWNFNMHLGRHHRFLQPFIDSTQCFLCRKTFESTNALLGHEKKGHGLEYLTRPEIFAPFCADFQGRRMKHSQ
jgi:hypothetical protein